MHIDQKIPKCDFCGTKFPQSVDGKGLIARGASGRYCVVMYACKPCGAVSGARGSGLTNEDMANIERDDPGSWFDV